MEFILEAPCFQEKSKSFNLKQIVSRFGLPRPILSRAADSFQAETLHAGLPSRSRGPCIGNLRAEHRTGTVLMNMLERLLENTDIDAVDVSWPHLKRL